MQVWLFYMTRSKRWMSYTQMITERFGLYWVDDYIRDFVTILDPVEGKNLRSALNEIKIRLDVGLQTALPLSFRNRNQKPNIVLCFCSCCGTGPHSHVSTDGCGFLHGNNWYVSSQYDNGQDSRHGSVIKPSNGIPMNTMETSMKG